jgi:peptide/nickel transport system ATP-binding protein
MLLEIKNLSVRYRSDDAEICAVNRLNFEIGKKETLGLVGETGAGKTTTALSVIGLLPERTGRVTEGEILFKGENLLAKTQREKRAIRGSSISMIFQDPMTSLNPIMTVGSQVRESLEIHRAGARRKELDERVDELMNLVGIQARRKHEYPHQFSGGMRQRIGIALALACEPELLIADEPTTALDVTIQAQILTLMAELKAKLGTSMLMITHDLGVVARTCDRVAVIYAGEVVEKGAARDIFEGARRHPYTLGLFGSIPDLETKKNRLTPIEGLMPDPSNLPEGCKFHTRCKERREICARRAPGLYEEGGHMIACHLYADGTGREVGSGRGLASAD